MKHLTFILFLLLLGCKDVTVIQQNHTSERDSVMYSNFIMSFMLTNYQYVNFDNGALESLNSDNKYYKHVLADIQDKRIKKDPLDGFLGYKEIKDTELRVVLRIHRWCDYQPHLPNTIIYVSDQKNFENAFIFSDEKQPRLDSYNDSVKKDIYYSTAKFEFQLNNIAARLQIDSISQKKHLEHFISLVVDSLLSLKRISINDSTEIKSELDGYNKRENNPKCAICMENIDNEMNSMIKDIRTNQKNVLYYFTSSKYYLGFWRFQYIEEKGKVFVRTSFTKCMCGHPLYW